MSLCTVLSEPNGLYVFRKLGWSEDTWGQHTELTQTPWDELSEEDVEAAEVLGYDQETWEDPDEFTDPGAAPPLRCCRSTLAALAGCQTISFYVLLHPACTSSQPRLTVAALKRL